MGIVEFVLTVFHVDIKIAATEVTNVVVDAPHQRSPTKFLGEENVVLSIYGQRVHVQERQSGRYATVPIEISQFQFIRSIIINQPI